jgi:hypothetical protein
MALTGHQEAHELLLIEEADAWFEYLEAIRGVAARAAPAGDPHPPREAPPTRRSRLRSGKQSLIPWGEAYAKAFPIPLRRAPSEAARAHNHSGEIVCHFLGSDARSRRTRHAQSAPPQDPQLKK